MARPKKTQIELEPEIKTDLPEEENLLEEITYEQFDDKPFEPELNKQEKPSTRLARVVLILRHKEPKEIIIEILSNKTGERIQYNPELHSSLKPGDILNVP
jgi:hypothetical protein